VRIMKGGGLGVVLELFVFSKVAIPSATPYLHRNTSLK
jgi:hypothetical protein